MSYSARQGVRVASYLNVSWSSSDLLAVMLRFVSTIRRATVTHSTQQDVNQSHGAVCSTGSVPAQHLRYAFRVDTTWLRHSSSLRGVADGKKSLIRSFPSKVGESAVRLEPRERAGRVGRRRQKVATKRSRPSPRGSCGNSYKANGNGDLPSVVLSRCQHQSQVENQALPEFQAWRC